MLKYLSSFAANFFKKVSLKSKYFIEIVIFFINNKIIKVFQFGYINIKLRIKQEKYGTKALKFLFSTNLANFFLLIILTC